MKVSDDNVTYLQVIFYDDLWVECSYLYLRDNLDAIANICTANHSP